MANIITACRILCSIALLFCNALSPTFFVLYSLAGFSDMLDGTVARKTNTASELGSKLDTMSDFVLVAVCLIKLIPVVNIQSWVCVWIFVVVIVKIFNAICGYVILKKLVAIHNTANKLTGALLFAVPFTLRFIDLKYSAAVGCTVATVAAVWECHCIMTGIGASRE